MRPEADLMAPHSRFTSIYVAGADGSACARQISDHYREVASLEIIGAAPEHVQIVYRRALRCLVHARHDDELILAPEAQARAGFELDLKLRLDRPADAPASCGVAPRLKAAVTAGPLPPPASNQQRDEYFWLRSIRSDLAHAAADVHPPALAM